MKELKLKTVEGLELAVSLFECEDPKALIQVIHGAKEHKERYYDFIEYLNANGYAVITSDNRGHGASVNEDFPLGHFDGIYQIVSDQLLITEYIKKLYPGKKLYLFGHSLGSCIARIYLQEHDDEIEKLVMTGTVFPIPICPVGKVLCDVSMKLHGRDNPNSLPAKIANADEDSWVCANPETMYVYRRDKIVKGTTYTTAAVASIIESDAALTDYARYKCANPDLRILTVTGSGDVCSGGSIGLKSSIAALHKIGYKDVECIVYKGMKHEVINEKDKAKVYANILDFYNS